MGLPSGLKWAKSNIDLSQENKFAASPEQYECSFFSWANLGGHNPISESEFEYNWGSINAQAPWYEEQPYGYTPGAAVQTDIKQVRDAARMNIGWPWRMPTSEEFVELIENCRFINADGSEVGPSSADKRVLVNGILGIYLESRVNGARLFFACAGDGNRTSWQDRGAGGRYWSKTWVSDRYARALDFGSSGVYPLYGGSRYIGFAIRPVW